MQPKRLHLLLLAASVLLSAVVLAGTPAAAATGDQVPAQLAGIWVLQLSDGSYQYLILAGSNFTFFVNDARDKATGDVSVSGDTITFSNGNRCSKTGTYRWSITDGVLTFVPLTSDECRRAIYLPAGGWTRR